MEEKLNKLRESMDETIFKDTGISREEKFRILNALGSQKKFRLFNRGILNPILTVLVCLMLIPYIIYFGYENMTDSTPEQSNQSIQKNDDVISITGSKDNSKETHEKLSGTIDEHKDGLELIPNEHQSVVNTRIDTEPGYPYIVFNGYFYKKSAEIDAGKVGKKISEVKRIGDWELKKDGDSNEVPPGPIFAIKGMEPKDAIAAKQWSNRDVYVMFKKVEEVKPPDKNKIYGTKNDTEAAQIALKNIKEEVPRLFVLTDRSRFELISIGILAKNGPGASLTYAVPEGDTEVNGHDVQGFITFKQYGKKFPFEHSAFVKRSISVPKQVDGKVITENIEWKAPKLLETFEMNGIKWGYYEDMFQNKILLGIGNDFYFEIDSQGDFTLDHLKDVLKSYEVVE